MNIAFLISAHNDPQHLERLIEALPEDAEFFVHIDAKADIQQFAHTILDERVHFISERYNIMWGSFGQVKYQMALIREALNAEIHFDYLFSISGLDYPLWSNDHIAQHLIENNGKEFLYATCLAEEGADNRLYREYRFFNTRSWRYGTLKSKFRVAIRHIVKALGFRKSLFIKCGGKEYKLYKGGSWWGITRALAEKVIDIYDNEHDFVKYFVTAFGPDETFIHTIAMNSEFSSQCTLIKGNNIRLEDLSPLTYIEYGHEIKVFTESDYETLLASGKMFCRKTITGKSDKLLDMIDKVRNSSSV